ncbi:MAG: VOC family protein [Acidimicrobiales bacterium]
MNGNRIMHASVNVAGRLEEARAFYEGVLGLSLADRPEVPGIPGYFLKAGDAQVHLVGAPPSGGPIDPTAAHVCIGVDDIEAAAAELESRAVPYVRGSQGPGGAVTQIWIADPAGNTVELQADRVL